MNVFDNDILNQQNNLPSNGDNQTDSYSLDDHTKRREKVKTPPQPTGRMSRKTQLTMGRQDEGRFVPSSVPSTSTDTLQLEERFEMMLFNEKALEGGFCPKRRRLYDDLFTELNRITKVQCAERGLLFERVQNEFQQWMKTYEELYSSSMAYGMRTYLNRLAEEKNLELSVRELEDDCQRLADELNKESHRLGEVRQRLDEGRKPVDKELSALRSDARILRATKKRIRNELESTLTNILASPIFLGQPIDYEKKSS